MFLASWFAYSRIRAPKNGTEALNRAIELQNAGRCDKAVEILQNWMKGKNRDTSNDGFLCIQIAMIYIARAYNEPATRNEPILKAEQNLQQSLKFLEKRGPEDNSLDLDGIGGAYQAMGDLSDRDRCRFYESAREAFERQLPLIKAYTAYGKTLPLEPVRAEIRKHLSSVSEKSSKAGCQVH